MLDIKRSATIETPKKRYAITKKYIIPLKNLSSVPRSRKGFHIGTSIPSTQFLVASATEQFVPASTG